MNKRTALIATTIIGIIVMIMYYSGLSQYLSVENIKMHSTYLKQQVDENYFGSVLAFLVVFVTMLAFTLPVTGPMGIIAGFLFGLGAGTLYSMIAIVLGTTISFILVRRTLSQVMRIQYKDQLASFNERMKQYGFSYLITLQLLVVVPYFIINTLAALADVSLSTFMWTTAIGSLPVIAIYVFAGQQLYMIQTWRDIFSMHTLALLAVLATLGLLPMLIRRLRKTSL